MSRPLVSPCGGVVELITLVMDENELGTFERAEDLNSTVVLIIGERDSIHSCASRTTIAIPRPRGFVHARVSSRGGACTRGCLLASCMRSTN